MTAFSIEYEFEEIQLVGDGLMAWGTATLVEDGDGEFYVSEIQICGKTFNRHGYGSDQFFSSTNKDIFLTIAKQIETSQHAQETFGEALGDYRQGDPDRAHDERRDYQAMGWL
ncbi:hypothetical protein SAMN05892877_117116 [Rhizobium subbaraonis]|uniref:Uncharacterized protein n=1 Tax=Rhizobium subbaraonis TaxID=908946 RepID=A0A285UVM3_9HYPH|nr:hypothetical protein [Rhizobium subbaraonis]SOC45727.1 hypothetical protein SAMN05892877_117116 [Rhizobium subbaraonis]